MQNWSTRDYLPEAFGDCLIPVVRDGTVGTLQDDRVIVSGSVVYITSLCASCLFGAFFSLSLSFSQEPFRDSFHQVYDAEHSKSYLFFPAKSRLTFKGLVQDAGELLEKRGNAIVQRDLDLQKIRPGFATPSDKGFISAQFVIGKTSADPSVSPTGSDFHCAAGNNWFIQVVGRKRWEFIMPEYSAYVWPLKGGLYNFWNAQKDMEGAVQHIPREYVDLEPGDMIFNPPWQWHKIISKCRHLLICL